MITHRHTYLFAPGRWNGKGKLSLVGGSSSQINMAMIASRNGEGTITAHMEIGFDDQDIPDAVEIVYTIMPQESDDFSFSQYNSQIGQMQGEGSATENLIVLNYRSTDGAFGGNETVERIDDNTYFLRGTLSLHGMPNSILEASLIRGEV